MEIQAPANEFGVEILQNWKKCYKNGSNKCEPRTFRFRQRHGLVYRSIRGEAAGVNRYTVDTWKDRLQVLLNDYRPDDVFSADEVKIAVATN
ncbi:Tigger transposable element-derived protein [Trichinella spiralis]|uniref:Tigger transposable element-derived protein n=1 Tax=Trichinella spiralis TaxID=6334 RepID=A0ABR3KZL1_TRISP